MQLSSRGRYAMMAMAELAARQERWALRVPAAPVSLAEIAGCRELSLCFLEQLFCQLRRAGLVCSVRGPGGGYRLARPAERITVADIVCAVDDKLEAMCGAAKGSGARGSDRRDDRCPTHVLWQELGRHIHLFLAGVTLAEVVRGELAGRARQPAPRIVEIGEDAICEEPA